jgi:hypothetical protein
MSGSMEERLKRRKLDALKRGVHRVGGDQSIPLTTHVVGIGKAGANAICQIIRDLEPDAQSLPLLLSTLAIRTCVNCARWQPKYRLSGWR